MDRAACCSIHTGDEIGTLAQNVNDLYSNLLSTIEHLEQEKDAARDMERAKVDFLRAASHELKTPVTALNATLENMILGIGKYQDYAVWLPECDLSFSYKCGKLPGREFFIYNYNGPAAVLFVTPRLFLLR